MQNANCNNDDMHIITASNANKKLFFQGWKKSVEAFSQGKGSLSHRCTSILSQLDTSHLDEAISWSSSEEEDKSDSQRFRPNRTLASQINFDDCKRVHRRGRRHSSAQFFRSVEKKFKSGEKKRDDVLCSQVRKSNNNPDFSQDTLLNAAESFDEPNWADNLSILNKRINLSLISASPLSSDKLIDDAQIPPSCKGSQESKVTSPILVSEKAKYMKRKKNWSSQQKTKPNEQNSCKQPDPPPCSPVFKITKHRRRSSNRAPQKTLDTSRCETNISSCVRTVAPSSSSGSASCLASENAVVLTPSQMENVSDIPISPVLGKSTNKRQRPMIVDKLISPILGSKIKSSRPVKIQKLMPRNQLSCSAQESSNHLDLTLQDHKCSTSPNTEINSENIYQISRSMSSENLASAKRSLDFSGQCGVSTNLLINCDTSINRTDSAGCSQIECKQHNFNFQNDKFENAQNVTLPLAGSPIFGCTQFIEEANTEQIELASVLRSPRIPDHVQKKKKLSLSKKEVRKKTVTPNVIKINESPIVSKENAESETSTETGENHFPNDQQVGVPRDSHNQFVKNEQIYGKNLAEPAGWTTNYTLLIEEENSEPMEFASQDVFLPPTCLKQNKASPECLSFPLGSLNKIADKNDDVEDCGIDSCSSQSPENNQLTQIEKLPSSCVSSPVTISQSSSSAAPCVVSGLSAEKMPDDYNAPPKKGKKKLNPDGLASRLQRVLNRHRSSSRIWQYKQSKDCKASCATNVNMTRTTSMALSINHAWVEYSHVIIQGCIDADMSSGTISSCLNSLSNHVVLVLDPYIAVKVGKIMSAKKIRVFPPWQALKLRGISLILCAYCIEVLEIDNSKRIGNECVAGKATSVPVEEGFEGFLGASLPDIIFPQIVEKPTCSYQCTEANDEVDFNEETESPAKLSSISALVTNHYVGTATFDTLNLKILRVFQFREAESDQTSTKFASWSLLGQDFRGEICEVLLGNEQCNLSRRIWPNIKTGHIIGKVMTLTGFFPVQRISPFRVSKLWRVVSNISSIPCEQPVLYVLAASSSRWEGVVLDSVKKFDNLQLHFTPLSKILMEVTSTSTESTRVNIICRAFHTSYERLYVTDTEVSPRITVISVNPTAFLSLEVLKAPVLVILDLEVVSAGVLRVDKYSRISVLGTEDFCLTKDVYDSELFDCLAKLNPTLPDLQKDSSSKSLTTFSGTITGVDENSAYMWPACGICDNELLCLGDNSEKYRCEKCNDQCDNFVLRMSLQVLCSCPRLPPNTSVRLKLLQKTIEKLLPPSLLGDEGYDMNFVLGQKLGPLRCEILTFTDQNFILQELPF